MQKQQLSFDINDMVASEAVPLLHFSEELILQTQKILILTENPTLTQEEKKLLSESLYGSGRTLIIFSEKIK